MRRYRVMYDEDMNEEESYEEQDYEDVNIDDSVYILEED